MTELVRLAMAVPVAVFFAVRNRFFNDEFDQFIADQQQRLNDMAEGR